MEAWLIKDIAVMKNMTKKKEEKSGSWIRVDEIRLRSMDYRNTRILLETLATLKNTEVGYLIDDLNDQYGTTFRHNDYLRNKELPMDLRNACRTMHQTLGKQEEKIIEECLIESKKLFPFFGKCIMVLIAFVVVANWLRGF